MDHLKHAALRVMQALQLVFFVVFSTSCIQSVAHSSDKSDTNAAEPAKRIAVIIKDEPAEFYQEIISGMREEAARFNYIVDVHPSLGSPVEQYHELKGLIRDRVAAIVMATFDSPDYARGLADAKRSGIPVFAADIPQNRARRSVISTISSDNLAGGAQAADLMCTALRGQSGTIAVLYVNTRSSGERSAGNLVANIDDRIRGFRAS